MKHEKDTTKRGVLLAQKRELLGSVLRRIGMHQELKQRAQNKAEAKAVPATELQSDIHFKALMGRDFNQYQTPEAKVDAFFEKHAVLHKEGYCSKDVIVTKAQKQLFSDMIHQESLRPDDVAFYHGTHGQVGFVNDVTTEFRRQLELRSNPDCQILRPFDEAFSNSKTISSLMNTYAGKDKSPGFQESAISTNIFPFGSHAKKFEASYYYFLNNFTQEPPRKLLGDFLKRLRIDIDADPFAFQAIYDQHLSHSGGVCYQIFIDPEYLDHVASPAQENGGKNPLCKDGSTLRKFSEVLQSMRENPEKHAEYIKNIQARLYLDPTVMQNACIKTYRANPLTPDQNHQYMTAIRQLVRQCILERLEKSVYFPMEAFKGTSGRPNLVKQLQMLNTSEYFDQYNLMTEEPGDWAVKIPRLIEANRVDALVQLMIDTPALDLDKKYDESGLSGIPAIGILSQLYTGPIALAVYLTLQDHKQHLHINTAIRQIQEEALMQYVRLGDLERVKALFELEYRDDATSTDPDIMHLKKIMGSSFCIRQIIVKATEVAVEHNQPEILEWCLQKCLSLSLDKPDIYKELIDNAIEKGHIAMLKSALDNGLGMREEQATLINEKAQSSSGIINEEQEEQERSASPGF